MGRMRGLAPSTDQRVPVEFSQGHLVKLLWEDAIHPVHDPRFADAEGVFLGDGDHVIGLALNGEARAYPVGILNRREMVNPENLVLDTGNSVRHLPEVNPFRGSRGGYVVGVSLRDSAKAYPFLTR